jgi:UDP-N-acetylglucosamine:LPS N-acetylglucosamine transferase
MELLALEKPCILIPIPWVSHNEQFENAEILKRAGLAEILEEKNVNQQTFIQTISNTIKNIKDYYIKETSYKSVLSNEAAELIAKEIINITL